MKIGKVLLPRYDITKFTQDNFFKTTNTKRMPRSFPIPNMGVPRMT